MVIVRTLLIYGSLLLFPSMLLAQSQILDPFDPNAFGLTIDEETLDAEKTADELIRDAEVLFLDERPLDARTKLLLSLKKDPTSYKAHAMLSSYYLVHVGHFRLALRYIREAMKQFRKQHGAPPYEDTQDQIIHAHHLHILSQARLNLDDYKGALRALDEYQSYGYYQDWYPGSRAWILMKNGDLNEAIKISRLGLIAGAEPGRTLNILGILLSMTGQREQALKIFDEAITHEYSIAYGQPATPLNNAGEVYREIFQEEAAERSWMRATSLPDGCEHVLPALNLANVRMERLDYSGAKHAMDTFESCIAQYPLRNGEEHRAFVHLARGRIDLHTGNIESAIAHLREASRRQQWFGKIGTDIEDLQAGVQASLAFALEQQSARWNLTPTSDLSWYRYFTRLVDQSVNYLEAWWLKRRTRQLLIDELNFGEDLYIRNTDSMLEYGTIGTLLAEMPAATLEKRIALERKRDNRGPALNYYEGYLGENYIQNGMVDKGRTLLYSVVKRLRLPADAALKVHLLLRIASTLDIYSAEYRVAVEDAFLLNRAALPGYLTKLPINFLTKDPNVAALMEDSPFLADNSYRSDFLVTHAYEDNTHSFRFSSRANRVPSFTVQGDKPSNVLERLIKEVFQIGIEH